MINDGRMRHNNVNLYSIFVTIAGEWKLGGFEFMTATPYDANGQMQSLPNPIPIKILPGLNIYDPPEKNDPTKLRTVTAW